MRNVAAVVTGYLVFAVSAVLLFRLSGRAAHEAQDAGFVIGSTLYGMAFAALGGYTARAIGRARGLGCAAAVGALIAAGAALSLWAAPGSKWSPLAALLLMSPSALAGGALRRRSRTHGDQSR